MRLLVLLSCLFVTPLLASCNGKIPAAEKMVSNDGLYMEAAWIYLEAGNRTRAETILADLETILKSDHVNEEPVNTGVMASFKVSFRGGVSALFKPPKRPIHKPNRRSGREVSAYRIDRLLGFNLTPLTIRRDLTLVSQNCSACFEFGSVQYWMNDYLTAKDANLGDVDKSDKLRLFDAIIGNKDRHYENWLVDAQSRRRQVAIDNDDAFRYLGDRWLQDMANIGKPHCLVGLVERYRQLTRQTVKDLLDIYLESDEINNFFRYRPQVLSSFDQILAASTDRSRCP